MRPLIKYRESKKYPLAVTESKKMKPVAHPYAHRYNVWLFIRVYACRLRQTRIYLNARCRAPTFISILTTARQ